MRDKQKKKVLAIDQKTASILLLLLFDFVLFMDDRSQIKITIVNDLTLFFSLLFRIQRRFMQATTLARPAHGRNGFLPFSSRHNRVNGKETENSIFGQLKRVSD